MSETERFDIYDAAMCWIGQASRKEAHDAGLWHQTFHCWVIKDRTKLILQLRHEEKDTYPGMLDVSSAGHLLAGERVEDGVRELEEELGLQVAFDDLISCGVFAEEDHLADGRVDREFNHVFCCACDQPLDAYRLQATEVQGLYAVERSDFQQLLSGEIDSISAEAMHVVEGEPVMSVQQIKAHQLVPHDEGYYDLLFKHINQL